MYDCFQIWMNVRWTLMIVTPMLYASTSMDHLVVNVKLVTMVIQNNPVSGQMDATVLVRNFDHTHSLKEKDAVFVCPTIWHFFLGSCGLEYNTTRWNSVKIFIEYYYLFQCSICYVQEIWMPFKIMICKTLFKWKNWN